LRDPGRNITESGDCGLALCGGASDVVRNFACCQFLPSNGAPTTSDIYALMSCIRCVMAQIAVTASPVVAWTDEISLVISAVAFAVCAASDFTSEATTAKPRPASPAHAAYSIVALSARRFDAVEAEQINYGDAHRQTDRAR
jgi:hypothetical protein